MKTDELRSYFLYLDALRKSGATNMYGASSYLCRDWDIGKEDAKTVLLMWMETYDGESSALERASIANNCGVCGEDHDGNAPLVCATGDGV